jgi:uncharacterized protein YyaL (SSP411 family)
MEENPHTRDARASRGKDPGKCSNHLRFEKSPYLLQHADNPVDWYPWGPEAFERARRENKPIFLSIGYSTCHWCHVMERESFEDAEVAQLLNEVFVSIKVDREERPDLDNIYMTVCQMMTGSGGWPLTIIMTPEKKPFFAGTYFPKESRFGRIGMLDLIPRINEIWARQHDEAVRSADQITAALQEYSGNEAGGELGEVTLKTAYEQLAHRFDEQHGGFGDAPKFPTAHNLLFLLRYWRRSGNEEALGMVEKTLQAMRRGGIYDHVGFGFHRYSTDSLWLVPHFEKMLYDQALLAMTYTEAYQATRNPEYGQTAREVLSYVLRDMRSPQGGFYSAEDADSEGEEGKFYLWTEDEIRNILTPDEAHVVITVFTIEKGGNFHEEATGRRGGNNILSLKKDLHEIAHKLKMPEEQLRLRLENSRGKLFAARERRIHPQRDDKILLDWNGLMIAALAKGARVLDDPGYAEAAKGALDFILEYMRNPDGRLLHRYRDGQAALQANVDDYAFLIWGMIEFYETSFDVRYLQTALELNNDLLTHFWDDSAGAFYFSADDAEELLVRQKNIYDGAIPSGNSVAALNLVRLGRITAEADFEKKAARIGRAFSKAVNQAPSAYTQLMLPVDFMVGPAYEVIVAGSPEADDTKAMIRALRTNFIPNIIVLLRPSEERSPDITRLAEYTEHQSPIDGKATAYVCLNYNCKLPTTDSGKMLEMLDVKKP